MSPKKKWFRVLRLIWISCGAIFIIWMFYSYESKDVDQSYLANTSGLMAEETADLYSFVPRKGFDKVVIFFQGAMVDTEAYVPLCRQISDRGYKVLLIKMPWRLASIGYRKPIEMNLFADTTKEYILIGHSQGAKMAAQFLYEHPNLINKLILLATTHPREIDLSGVRIPIMKIYGSNDGVATVSAVEANKPKLPESTKFVLLKGANHAQFAHYGFQLGDHKANISREDQQRRVLQNIVEFLEEN